MSASVNAMCLPANPILVRSENIPAVSPGTEGRSTGCYQPSSTRASNGLTGFSATPYYRPRDHFCQRQFYREGASLRKLKHKEH